MLKGPFFLVLAAQAALFAQIDRSPVPYPGQYPGGTGVPGIPFPVPRRGRQGPTGTNRPEEATTRASGKLRKIDDKAVVVEAHDGRVLDFRRNASTKFYKESREISASDLKPGDEVTVEATTNQQGYLIASSVSWEADAADKVETTKGPGATSPAPAPAPAPRDPDDPGPPTLKRGTPAPRQASEPQSETAASAPPELPPVPAVDPYVEKARAAAESFSEGLPDYVCKEFMARYISTTRPVNWHALDVVSTDVVYEKGKESYRNVAINGKLANKSIEQLEGAWSTGEFASMLLDLLSPATDADFRFRRQSTTAGVTARVYDFDVQQPNSHWHVMVASQSIDPAYKGSVWIEAASGRVLRIEMQARALPKEFPMDTVESSVDYDRVRIGDREFLLPVHSESLSCQRGASNCSRNSLDFRNYHKYDANSNIDYSASTSN